MSKHQPELPVIQEPATAEYFPDGDDGVAWSVNDWRGLSAAFGIRQDELVRWHLELAESGRPWTVIRRIFGVMASFGDAVQTEDMEEDGWNWKKLAARLGVPEKELRADLDAAVEFWQKQRLASAVQRPAAVNSIDPPPEASPFRVRQKISEAEIDALLDQYDFEVKGKDRVFVAKRITELRSVLADSHRREPAIQLIHMELNLRANRAIGTLLKERLDKLLEKPSLESKESGEVQKIQESLVNNDAAHTKLLEKYMAASAQIGAEEIMEGEARRVAIGTISQFVEAHREYYSKGDRSLVDGVFAADEVIWQTNPIPMRPAQYRPDIVARISEALRPENLWNGGYEPAPIPREVSRRLLKLAKGLTEEQEQAVIPEIDDTSSDEESDEADPVAPAIPDDQPVAHLAAPAVPERSPAVAASSPEDYMAIG